MITNQLIKFIPEDNDCRDAAELPQDPEGPDSQPFVVGTMKTAANQQVPRIQGELKPEDHLGAFKVRWGIGRMNYDVTPGLYALGCPGPHSPVLVTANYKVSFDRLRSAYAGRNAWILVLDTDGINVWCAAGKNSFSTNELTYRLHDSALSDVVDHRRLILPQLSGPGISAWEVEKTTGFKVVYGPVRAEDLPRFMDRGMEATNAMRIKQFPLSERLALTPMECLPTLKWFIGILPFFLLLAGLIYPGRFSDNIASHGVTAALLLTAGMVTGTVLTPIFLPWLPGRSFAVKGGSAGIITGTFILLLSATQTSLSYSLTEGIGLLIIACGFSSYLGLNFTGSSPYTSFSGVKKEMKLAIPVQISAVLIGFILWISTGFGLIAS